MKKERTFAFKDVILRSIKTSDVEDRLTLGVSDKLATMTGSQFDKVGNFSLTHANEWYERCLNHPCKWVIDYKNKCIGTVSLRPLIEDNKAKLAIEIYDDKLHGKGIGTKVIYKVLDFAFKEQKYHKVFLRVLDYNTNAINLYEKVGFTLEGIDVEGARINGTYYSDHYMGILRRHYLEVEDDQKQITQS